MNRHPPEVTLAIWGHMVDGIGPKESKARFERGETLLKRPYDIPLATLKDKRRTLRKQKGDPRAVVEAGQEMAKAADAKRLMIEAVYDEAHQLRAAQRKGALNLDGMRKLEAAIRIIDGIEARVMRERKRTKRNAGEAQGPDIRRAQDSELVAKLKRTAKVETVPGPPRTYEGEGDAEPLEEGAESIDAGRLNAAA